MTWRVLDLFCGAGGAAMGLHRAWPDAEIIGVDINPQPRYPFTFVIADALHPPFDLSQFNFIWASPPCQAYQMMNHVNHKRWGFVSKAPRLIVPIRRMLESSGKPYVIENVQGAPVLTQIILCGQSFGLPMARHRHFESNRLLFARPCSHRGKYNIAVYGRISKRVIIKRVDGSASSISASSIAEARNSMGIDWMEDGEIQEAIPPAYSEFIARQIR